MAITIRINTATCIHCNKCVQICPAEIFTQDIVSKEITAHNTENCIACGHCACACPSSSVVHSLFPTETIHAFNRTDLPTPEQVLLLCQARRSNRTFTKKPIATEHLTTILEAAHRAPTARNLQQVAFTLITDPEKLRAVTQFTIETFTAVTRKLNHPLLKPLLKLLMPDAYSYLPVFERMDTEFRQGLDPILHNATALILIHTPKKNQFGSIDANLAYQNGSLMAESLNISQLYTGFVYVATRRRKQALEKLLGIHGEIQAGMALGVPAFLLTNYLDKKPIQVSR